MALAAAFDEVKANQTAVGSGLAGRNGKGLLVRFMGSRDDPALPLATLGYHERGYFNGPHFHTVDQFQVVVKGAGTLGRHDLRPYAIHFSRAYTPYGPLVSNADDGLTHFVLRAHPDTDSQRLPQEREQLQRAIHRRPWQITRRAEFPALRGDSATGDFVLQAVPGMENGEGLAAYTLRMKPNTEGEAPDPAHGDGQFLVVLKGSLWHASKECRALALVFVRSDEAPYRMHAGAAGLEALVLNFPARLAAATRAAATTSAAAGLKTWQCTLCSFRYDEAAGLPHEGIAPGTRWQDVPATWSCPDCSASKSDFRMAALPPT